MNWFKSSARRASRAPGVPQARHVTERAVAPYLRADLTSLHETMLELNHRLSHVEAQTADHAAHIGDMQRHLPAVLNAISSINGTTRLVRRELADARRELTEAEELRDGIVPHIESIRWLLQRVETIRAEVLHELRYGRATDAGQPEGPDVEVVDPARLDVADVRLNLGCGHLPIEGFVNVDMRKLPGVDVVAPVDALPVEPGTVAEIFSAHVLEHFPQVELQRRLLPYWTGLLRPGGTFRAVVPDVVAMSEQLHAGDISFEEFRAVVYGGQEYEGDFHFTAFTPDSLRELLEAAGLDSVTLIERGRKNADCLELEMSARRPA